MSEDVREIRSVVRAWLPPDLLEHEDRVVAHPIVRALAGLSLPDIVAPGADPDIPLVEDADEAQRACVAAVVRGRSFVLDGPPGAGRSATTATMIGGLLYAGKRVLFVSPDASALAAVRDRLVAAGLGADLLEPGPGEAVVREPAVAASSPGMPVAGPGVDRAALEALETRLSEYATAINEVRAEAGASLYEILGRCAELAGVPDAPPPDPVPATLDAGDRQRIRGAAERLGRYGWNAGPETFRWHDVIDPEPLTARVRRARSALRALAARAGRHADVVAAFGLDGPGDAPALAALLAEATRRPAGRGGAERGRTGKPAVPMPSELAAVARPSELAAVARPSGFSGVASPERAARPVAPELVRLTAELPAVPVAPELIPPAVALGGLTAAAAAELAGRFSADAGGLDRCRDEATAAAHRLGLPPVVTFADLARLVALAGLGARRHRPEPFWFGPGVLATAIDAITALRKAGQAVVLAEGQARRWFDPAILGRPVEELADRFAHVHRGMRQLLRPYRRDWETVAAFALPSVAPAEAVEQVSAAAAWKRALRELAAAERRHAPVLGRYWQRDRTDHAALQEALHAAGEVLRLTPPGSLAAVAGHVCHPAPDEVLTAMVATAAETLDRWRTIPVPPGGRLHDAAAWLRAQVPALAGTAEFLRAYRDATGEDVELASAVGNVDASRRAAHASRRAADAAGRAASAPERPEPGDRALTAEQAAALRRARPPGDLAARADAWRTARDAVVAAFADSRRAELEATFARYDTARQLLDDLAADPGGQRDRSARLDDRRLLAGFGLRPALDHCASRRIAPDLVASVIERAALRGWADAIIRADPRLHPLGGADRDRLVARFRRLDGQRAAEAPARIAAARHRQREAAIHGAGPGAALLRREAQRNVSARELIGRAPETVLALKPCFLLPTPDAGRFLPADLRFDVVIIDEASRTGPAEIVGCAYRGDSLVLAGGFPSALQRPGDGGPFPVMTAGGPATLPGPEATAPPSLEAAPPPGPGAAAEQPPAPSGWERSVRDTIESWGYEVRPGPGSPDHRIDLVVRHAGSDILGVEGDGPAYASAPDARDRDRLRPRALAAIGWRLHRVWSTAWHTSRAVEERRLRTAIDEAVRANGADRPHRVRLRAAPQPMRPEIAAR